MKINYNNIYNYNNNMDDISNWIRCLLKIKYIYKTFKNKKNKKKFFLNFLILKYI